MAICNRPGCVSEALKDMPACFVHTLQLGTVCSQCQGSGSVMRPSSESRPGDLTPRLVRDACDHCGGCGLKDKTKAVQPQVPKELKHQPVEERPLIMLARDEDGPDALTVAEGGL